MKKELEELVVNNLGLVYDVLKKHKGILKYYEFEDAIQLGNLALIQAANTFDNTKQVAFSTYAFNCIHNYFHIHIVKATRAKNTAKILSLDETLVLEEEYTLADIISSEENVAESFIQKSQADELKKHINNLDNEFEKNIMQLRLQDKTFEQIAEILKSNLSAVHLAYNKALNKLRYKFKVDKGDDIE